MRYVGIDYHKRYSVLCATDERGQPVREGRIAGNSESGFAQFFASLGEPSAVVLEACWNWGWLYDLLGELPRVQRVVLAHPYKTRLIAEAQIKTDQIDAHTLARLLRAELVAQSHAPSAATRARKHLLRQRLFWVRLRTMLRNRTHAILDRQRGLARPQLADVFSKRGQSWLQKVELPAAADQPLLAQDLEVMKLLEAKIKELDRLIGQTQSEAERLLESVPGIGSVFSSVIATEIDGIERFVSAAKLCAYAGVVPSTHASGGRVHHGRLLWQCNKWLRWALIEASWSAIQFSGTFGSIYRAARERGKNQNVAITMVAHRLCQIIWLMLREQRPYVEAAPMNQRTKKTFPDRSEPQVREAARPRRVRLASAR
jgi:transposase